MISSKKYVDETLRKNNLVANKSLGQNFLVESDIATFIVDSANISKDTCVIEIGPGLGALTEIALEKADLVMAFEIDANMVKILTETFKEKENFILTNIDFLKVDIEKLIKNLDEVIKETSKYLKTLKIDLDKIIEKESTFDQLEELRNAYNKLVEKDATKDRFKVLSNTMINLYEASKPEIFEMGWENEMFAPINYINGLFYNLIDDEKVERARNKMQKILDSSVTANDAVDEQEYVIKGSKVIDLTKIDVSDIKKRLKEAPYKAVEIDDLRQFV